MILTYSRDGFVTVIQSGTKIHTIRTDTKRRWKPGMKIQYWCGNRGTFDKIPAGAEAALTRAALARRLRRVPLIPVGCAGKRTAPPFHLRFRINRTKLHECLAVSYQLS